ncbi:hypothetical protein VKT23_020104 [Stygiomarasmius scandens]|uniref:Uncharacterized protein n=1 Tax=Marasmiellus scandens TaxID=2682957 RepID=A0ABR1IJR0_9AGAR
MLSKMLVTLTLAAVGVSAAALTIPERRQISSQHGTLVAPTTGDQVTSGGTVPFQYADSNWCHNGYTPIGVWLTDYQPTTADVNTTTGVFDEGKFAHFFGNFLVPNFGLPVLTGSTPPPSSLTLPDMSGSFAEGSELFLAVVETANSCPPGVGVPPQYGLTGTSLVLA